jgi:hypothetical protein
MNYIFLHLLFLSAEKSGLRHVERHLGVNYRDIEDLFDLAIINKLPFFIASKNSFSLIKFLLIKK